MALSRKKYQIAYSKLLPLRNGHTLDYFHYTVVDSTNREIERLLKLRDRNFIFAAGADHQENGTGRSGNTWYDIEHGTMMFSIYFPRAMVDINQDTVISLIYTIQLYVEKIFPSISLVKKPPNDLLSTDGEKLLGVMLKVVNGGYILGVGVNTDLTRDEVAELKVKTAVSITSLKVLGGDDVSIARFKSGFIVKLVEFLTAD